MKNQFSNLMHLAVKSLFLMLIPLSMVGNSYGATNNIGNKTAIHEVTVTNMQELLENIRPNTFIHLKSGAYKITQNTFQSEFARVDNLGIIINNLVNLSIIGEKNTVIGADSNGMNIILAIRECKNIFFENIIMKYSSSRETPIYQYFPPILTIAASENVTLKNVLINGFPSRGIQLGGSKNIEIHDSTIKDMKYNFFGMTDSSDVIFKKVTFDRLEQGVLAEMYNSSVHLLNCEIVNSHFTNEIVKPYRSFIAIEGSKFMNNTGYDFSERGDESSWLMNNVLANNPELDSKLNSYQTQNNERNIVYYFRLLSSFFKFEYPLFYKDGKWLTYNDMCDEEQAATVDIQNGFISIYDGCFNGNVTYDFALFKNNKGEDFIGVNSILYSGSPIPDKSSIGFYKFDNESLKPVNITNEIFSIGIEDFQIEGTDKQLYLKVAKLAGLKGVPLAIYKLPEIGTDLIATLIPTKGLCDYMIKLNSLNPDETEKALIKQYEDSIQTNSITFKWDKNLSRFVKVK